MKKVIGVLLLLLVGIISAEGMTHNASDICVRLGNANVPLSYAISENLFNSNSPFIVSENCEGSHYADYILISNPDENIMTLQEAIDNSKITGGKFVSKDTKNSFEGHEYSSDVILDDGSTLQEAIKNYNVCKGWSCKDYNFNCDSHDNGCGITLNCGECLAGQHCNNGICGECEYGGNVILEKNCDALDTVKKDYISVQRTCQKNGIWSDPACDVYYYWDEGSWGVATEIKDCSYKKYRTVTCKKSDGTIVDNSFCSSMSKPFNSETHNRCTWKKGSYIAVWFTTKYCKFYTPCTNPGKTNLCMVSEDCFLLWCDGYKQTCTQSPVS